MLGYIIYAVASLLGVVIDSIAKGEESEKTRQFNHDEAQLAYERSLEADSTSMQRMVADYQKAGINPMMAVSGGTGSVQSPAASVSAANVGVMNMSGLLSAMLGAEQLKEQKRVNNAEIENIEADTARKQAETEGLNLDNEIKTATKQAVIDAAQIKNDLSRSQVNAVNKGLDEADARIAKLRQEAVTEEQKRSLMSAQTTLAKANAYQVVELLPYSQQLMLAKTEGERAAALLAAAHTAYQNHLIDDGYLEAFVRNMKSTADSAEAKADMEKIKAALRTGDYSKVGNIVRGSFAQDFMQDMTILLDNLNPLNNIFK